LAKNYTTLSFHVRLERQKRKAPGGKTDEALFKKKKRFLFLRLGLAKTDHPVALFPLAALLQKLDPLITFEDRALGAGGR
jgi:hypothetical protein